MISGMPINLLLSATFTGIFVFIGAWVGLELTISPDGIAILWPANAILLAALLQTPQSDWTLLAFVGLIAFSAASFSASFPLWSVSLFALVNLVEVLMAAILIRWLAGKEFNFQSLRGMIVFFLAGPLVACSLAAILGASIYESLARTDNQLVVLWRLWWFGDAVGMILFTPLVISAWNAKIARKQAFSKKRLMNLAEVTAIWAGVAITGIFAFHSAGHADVALRHGNLEIFLAPALLLGFAIWSAARLDILATTMTVTFIAALLTAFLVQPIPFLTTVMLPQDAVWLTQEYLVVISVIAVALSGLMQSFRHQRASLQLKDRALDASNDAISIVDVQQAGMPVTWVNPKFEELFGYSSEEIIGRNWGLLQEGIRQQYGLETVSTAIADKKPGRAELQNYTKNGEPLWIDFSVAPVTDCAGQVTHCVAIHHDRTLAKDTEERLKDATNAALWHNKLLEEKVQERTASLEKLNDELEEVASMDFLTGIANRRHFYELGQRELKRLRLDGLTASLIAFDLDNFKAINDNYGHESGDQVLQQIVTPVETMIRPTDSFGRVGGDEFLIFFKDTPQSKAMEIAERIRTEIAKVLSSFGSDRLGVTASFGVAEWDRKCDLSQLIHRADIALYQAKAEGRNSVCAWHPELDRQADASGHSDTG